MIGEPSAPEGHSLALVIRRRSNTNMKPRVALSRFFACERQWMWPTSFAQTAPTLHPAETVADGRPRRLGIDRLVARRLFKAGAFPHHR